MYKTLRNRMILRAITIVLSLSTVFIWGGCAQVATQPENTPEATVQQPAVQPSAQPEENDVLYDWAEEADVIIVGSGGAGFSAALEASAAGANVLVLEKAGIPGGNTLLSGGMILAGGTEYQKELGITDTRESFAAQQMAYHRTAGDIKMVEEMSLASPEAFEFMRGIGRNYGVVSLMPPAWGYDTDETWAPRTHWDAVDTTGHFMRLLEAVNDRENIRYYTESEVVRLIVNEDNEVVGVETIHGDQYRANKGVILACGSFDANMEMAKQYNPMQHWAMSFTENFDYVVKPQTVNNTGDGIRMAQEIGADLMLSDANCISDLTFLGGDQPLHGTILVNSNAERFVQESAHWGYLNSMVYQEAVRTNKIDTDSTHFWIITDQLAVDNGLYINAAVTDRGVIAKQGFADLIAKADTIEELAEKTGLPAENLINTVNRWNDFADKGEDRNFNRKNVGEFIHLQELSQAPYYAIPYVPTRMGSFGGLKTNDQTQVLHVNGEPISRLYAAGSIMSGMYTGEFYSSCGWSILGTVHWGRKAGENVAGLSAWTSETVVAKEKEEQQVQVQAGNYNAGSYTATVAGHNGDVPVTVEFSDTAITNITVGTHGETEGIGTVAIEKLTERILAGQSADIDTVSGATVTSSAFLAAAKDCIDQANR